MVELRDYMTGKEHSIAEPDIGYVGPFTIKGFSMEGEAQGKWSMKLANGEKFTSAGGISLYVQLAKLLIRRALDKEAAKEAQELLENPLEDDDEQLEDDELKDLGFNDSNRIDDEGEEKA
jgi:hypothetical protein